MSKHHPPWKEHTFRPWMHHHPPWPPGPGWREFPRLARGRRRLRGLLFLRFVAVFGLIVLLVLGGMGVLAFLFTRLMGGGGRAAALVWVSGCGLSLALPLLAAVLAARAFRGIATPLSDVMAAADAVAQGDLSVRVPAHGPGDFQRLAESFNRMTEELQRVDRQRRNLTADVAHELRTPLHIIQGNLEGILDDVYQATPEHVAATLEETRALSRLVDDLRTLSLAETGTLPLEREPVDVVELLADVATSFSGQAEAAGIQLRVEPAIDGGNAGGPPLVVTGDAGRLDQVLSNLMANAIRHTPRGGTVELQASPAPDGVRITVRDTGAGIPAADLPHIFDRFWRGDPSRSHAAGAGSGLGLAIVRQLVQAHQGTIGVESHVGQGTTFTILLPASG